MRSFLVALVMFIFLVGTFPIYLITLIVRLFSKRACARFSQSFVNAAFKFLMWIAGAKITVLGRENIPTDQAVLYVSNHRSYADIPLGYMTVGGLTGFIAKKKLRNSPYFHSG